MSATGFMLKALLLFSILQLTLGVFGSPLARHLVTELVDEHLLDRRQSSSNGTVVVTGVTGFGAQPRQEIRQLQKNADQWNLYLLGMHRFMATNESDKMSYYQIAGIHGRPYVAWDNVQAAPGINNPGYCAHVSNLFLTWHRPYLALFEQALYQHVVAAVNEFPSGPIRQRYAQAALAFRMPYWDWATAPPPGQSVWPSSLTSPTVTVTMPNGTNTIPNPLYSYRFNPIRPDDMYFNPFATWPETMRYPTDWNLTAKSQPELIGPVLDNNRVSFMDRLYNLFTNYDNFTEFGNEAWMHGGVQNADSLESIHDIIHGIVGSQGHMTYLDYSAFDPVFFLHHTMLDRVFALWQVLYPDSYVQPMKAVEQTFTIPMNSVQDVNSPLDPFHTDSKGGKWTSQSARSVTQFGYTYPELQNNANASAVRTAINKLYGDSAGSGGIRGSPTRRWFKDHAVQEREVPTESDSASSTAAASGDIDDGKHREYLANIVSQKFAMGTSYAIYIFLGDFDDDPRCYNLAPNLVGTHGVFAASAADDDDNPQAKLVRRMEMAPILVTGTMPLNSMLLAKVQTGELGSMDSHDVEDYLNDKLQWRIAFVSAYTKD